MKTIITLTRVYKKEVQIVVDEELLKGKNEEQITDFLWNEYNYPNEEELEDLFENTKFVEISFNEDSLSEADTDRYDIEDEEGNIIHGGHL